MKAAASTKMGKTPLADNCQEPAPYAVVLTWWIGAYALVFGIAVLVLAFRLRAKFKPLRAALLSVVSFALISINSQIALALYHRNC